MKMEKTSTMFKARCQVVATAAEVVRAGNAARAKVMLFNGFARVERELHGVRVGAKNGETEMIMFPDKSTVLASLVNGASVAVPALMKRQVRW